MQLYGIKTFPHLWKLTQSETFLKQLMSLVCTWCRFQAYSSSPRSVNTNPGADNCLFSSRLNHMELLIMDFLSMDNFARYINRLHPNWKRCAFLHTEFSKCLPNGRKHLDAFLFKPSWEVVELFPSLIDERRWSDTDSDAGIGWCWGQTRWVMLRREAWNQPVPWCFCRDLSARKMTRGRWQWALGQGWH